MKLGVLAHTFGKQPTSSLAARIAGSGFTSVQLALAKALSDIDSSNGKLSPGLANWVGEQFHNEGIRIAVLGCYINPVNPDAAVRKSELARFKEHLRYARDFGCSIVATETGSVTTYKETHPTSYEEQGFQVLRESVLELAEEADKWGVHVAIEPVSVHTLHTREHMQRLLEEVPSSSVGLLFDPCNLIKVEHVVDQADFLRDVFDQLYDRMIAIHAKDVAFDVSGKKYNPVPGEGILDYPLFFELLKAYKPHIDISLEGVTAEQADDAAAYLRRLWHADN
ncbi:sugar phosphate isomerase/epimerase family protein [Paenibacillus sp. 453mf]|uniref:sugar phosphate isomerase/epimerase family protein n=1 Tax=Paenibacillus sp. 453mf TaxID=1761874 RepID=UPI0008EB219A|nr:sugar phosphate isomerase/epimerase family protein [Paenibacillus sp. 453mf]SFS93680.1 Sugar phosphate isomerase/epimerase [Paenibacillus sp. 453mf]